DRNVTGVQTCALAILLDNNFSLFLPFTTDFGKNIKIKKNVFINSGCRFQDQGKIIIGEGSLIGHNVVLATINHDYNPLNRGTMRSEERRVGKDSCSPR